MAKRIIILSLAFLFFSCGSYVDKKSEEIKKQNPQVAFVDVNVVSVRYGAIIYNQTVLIKDGSIELVAPSSMVRVPSGYLKVNGRGKYLMPGLVDMHVHITKEYDLMLYIANGVTTVRNMWGESSFLTLFGFPDQKKLRDLINEEEIIGPTIYTSGPVIDGTPAASAFMTVVKNEREATRAVRRQKDQGYDFIKIYDNLPVDLFNVIINTADESDMRVSGHVPSKVGLENAIEARMASVEHLTGLMDRESGVKIIPDKKMWAYARDLRQSGIYICPTIIDIQRRFTHNKDIQINKIGELKYIDWRRKFVWGQTLRSINDNLKEKYADYEKGTYTARTSAMMKTLTRNLYSSGVKLLVGTNAGNPYVVPGFSLYDELNNYVSLGIPAAQAIKMATYDAAKFMDLDDEFGSVQKGMRADLLLLDANPLLSIKNLKKRAGVMVKGRWIHREKLKDILAGLDRS